MMRNSIVFLAILVLFVAGITYSKAADSETLAILKSVEGKWNSKIRGIDGKMYIRPWIFKVENDYFSATIKRPGLDPEECKVSIQEISEDKGVLKLKIKFPPFSSADLEITRGAIKGMGWRPGAYAAGVSDIDFERR